MPIYVCHGAFELKLKELKLTSPSNLFLNLSNMEVNFVHYGKPRMRLKILLKIYQFFIDIDECLSGCILQFPAKIN